MLLFLLSSPSVIVTDTMPPSLRELGWELDLYYYGADLINHDACDVFRNTRNKTLTKELHDNTIRALFKLHGYDKKTPKRNPALDFILETDFAFVLEADHDRSFSANDALAPLLLEKK